MYLSAFLHRNEFFEIINRWLSDKLKPKDPLQITRIITYDSYVAWETTLCFIHNLLKSLTNVPIHRHPIARKKELKDSLCNTKHPKSDRAKSLVAEYLNNPEFYYIGSPIAGCIFYSPLFQILSVCRLKRVKRIAEKSSRYAKMHIFEKLKAFANEISIKNTVPLPPTEQIPPDLLVDAEKALMLLIKENGINLPVDPMTIKDILGIKIIDYGYGEKKLESAIRGADGVKIVEKERHTGLYNAIHYVVELPINLDYVIGKFCHNNKKVDFALRGLPANNVNEDFAKFIVTGDNTVQLELILTSFEELIESEIGRSMHETRIFEQRQEQRFQGNIIINIEYIIEYLFAVGLSPAIQVDEIPIKIWGRYLPDTLSYRIRTLYQISEHSLIDV